MIPGDRDSHRVALVFFGLFLATLGYLLLRADIAPRPLGYALVAAGLAAYTLVIPQLPAPMTAVALGFGGLAEGALSVILDGPPSCLYICADDKGTLAQGNSNRG